MIGHHTYDPVLGEFVNDIHQRIAKIINDYDPNLHLMAVEGEGGFVNGEKYVLVHAPQNAEPSLVMFLDAAEINEHLLARIWLNDSRKNDPQAYLEKLQAARTAIHLKEEMERRAEFQDKATFMLRSPLHTINMGNGRKVRT